MGRQEMGWEGPEHPRPHRLGPLMAVAVSVLLCGPGKGDRAGAHGGLQEERGGGGRCLGFPSPCGDSQESFCFLAQADLAAGQMRLRFLD